MRDELVELLLTAHRLPRPDRQFVCDKAAARIEALSARVRELEEALELADAALRGARMNMDVVERKICAALGDKQ